MSQKPSYFNNGEFNLA